MDYFKLGNVLNKLWWSYLPFLCGCHVNFMKFDCHKDGFVGERFNREHALTHTHTNVSRQLAEGAVAMTSTTI